jgi:hypothetical protein
LACKPSRSFFWHDGYRKSLMPRCQQQLSFSSSMEYSNLIHDRQQCNHNGNNTLGAHGVGSDDLHAFSRHAFLRQHFEERLYVMSLHQRGPC